MNESESPPHKKRRLGLQQNQEEATAIIQNTRTPTLCGNGHFRYGPLACKMFLRASELNLHFKKITTGESVTSSVSCAKKYFEDEGSAVSDEQ